jgi:hypothetical protein
MLTQTLGLLEGLLVVMTLTVGALVLSVVYGALAGKQTLSLPYLAGMLSAILIGAVLYSALGTAAIAIVLLHYAAWCLIAGLVERYRHKRSLSP